jgi:hypothetical protein
VATNFVLAKSGALYLHPLITNGLLDLTSPLRRGVLFLEMSPVDSIAVQFITVVEPSATKEIP